MVNPAIPAPITQTSVVSSLESDWCRGTVAVSIQTDFVTSRTGFAMAVSPGGGEREQRGSCLERVSQTISTSTELANTVPDSHRATKAGISLEIPAGFLRRDSWGAVGAYWLPHHGGFIMESRLAILRAGRSRADVVLYAVR